MIISGYEDFVKQKSYISFGLSTEFSLVGIGAPIHVYLPDVALALKTGCIINENASIANAVGAITGSVSVEERVVIKPRYTPAGIEGYDIFSPRVKMHFDDYKLAKTWAEDEAIAIVEEMAIARGANEVTTSVDIGENNTEINILAAQSQEDIDDTDEMESTRDILLETIITAKAIGGIKWI